MEFKLRFAIDSKRGDFFVYRDMQGIPTFCILLTNDLVAKFNCLDREVLCGSVSLYMLVSNLSTGSRHFDKDGVQWIKRIR